jgi:hypothetical protein
MAKENRPAKAFHLNKTDSQRGDGSPRLQINRLRYKLGLSGPAAASLAHLIFGEGEQ